jgi:hypothetical protein
VIAPCKYQDFLQDVEVRLAVGFVVYEIQLGSLQYYLLLLANHYYASALSSHQPTAVVGPQFGLWCVR